MQIISQIIFAIVLAFGGWKAFQQFSKIRRNILLGKDLEIAGTKQQRFKNMLLIAFGQQKMFAKPIPALLHLCVYLGFVIINIEVLEIILDGLLGTHRLFLSFLPLGFYQFVINSFEVLALLVIVACVVFLIRRNTLKIPRFQSKELIGFAHNDANIILYIEIVLMFAFLLMNAADTNLQFLGNKHYHETGNFLISQNLIFFTSGISESGLIIIERSAWWFHILGILAFLNYLPQSKHLHIMLAFPSSYYSSQEPKGKMDNMPEVTKEVKLMLNLPLSEEEQKIEAGKFGAKDVTDLSWKNLLDAYTCTECGRCTSQCPANLTGKELSPRKILMDTRDRLQEVGHNIDANSPDQKSLLGDYITHEEILACTTCNACTEACPINLNPLDIILKLRRYKIMEESAAPSSWNNMMATIETNLSPWKFSPSDRANWAKED